jgi:tetratricopeptide (TPR) repeat protein
VDQGTCYRGIGKFDKAVEQYRKALKIDPKFPNGHRNLAVVLAYDLHDTKEGIKEFQKYLEIAPNAPDVETIRQTIRELSAKK